MPNVYVVTEGKTDVMILQYLLPSKYQDDIEFFDGGGRSGAISLAATLLGVRRTPVVLMIDTDSTQPDAVAERKELPGYFMKRASASVPYLVVANEPEVEVLLLSNQAILEQLAGRFFSSFEWDSARRDPKGFLAAIGVTNQAVLEAIKTSGQVVSHPTLTEIIGFLESVKLAHAA